MLPLTVLDQLSPSESPDDDAALATIGSFSAPSQRSQLQRNLYGLAQNEKEAPAPVDQPPAPPTAKKPAEIPEDQQPDVGNEPLTPIPQKTWFSGKSFKAIQNTLTGDKKNPGKAPGITVRGLVPGPDGQDIVTVLAESTDVLEQALEAKMESGEMVLNPSNTLFSVKGSDSEVSELQSKLMKEYPGIEINQEPTDEEKEQQKRDENMALQQVAEESERQQKFNFATQDLGQSPEEASRTIVYGLGEEAYKTKVKEYDTAIKQIDAKISEATMALEAIPDGHWAANPEADIPAESYTDRLSRTNSAEKKLEDYKEMKKSYISQRQNLSQMKEGPQTRDYERVKTAAKAKEIKEPVKNIRQEKLRFWEDNALLPKPRKDYASTIYDSAENDVDAVISAASAKRESAINRKQLEKKLGIDDDTSGIVFIQSASGGSITPEKADDPETEYQLREALLADVWKGGTLTPDFLDVASTIQLDFTEEDWADLDARRKKAKENKESLGEATAQFISDRVRTKGVGLEKDLDADAVARYLAFLDSPQSQTILTAWDWNQSSKTFKEQRVKEAIAAGMEPAQAFKESLLTMRELNKHFNWPADNNVGIDEMIAKTDIPLYDQDDE